MVDQYYRKSGPRSGGRFKKLFKNRTVLLTLLIVVPILSFVTFSNKGVLRRFSLEGEKREMQEKIHLAQKEQLHLQEESRLLDGDSRTIEKCAREKYGMIREGETVYKVKKEK